VAALRPEATVATQAMFVLELTRTYPSWAEYSDENSLYASPEGMISRLRRCGLVGGGGGGGGGRQAGSKRRHRLLEHL
jgi:hypothetical protein